METCLHGQRRSLDRLRMRFLGLGFEALKLDFLDDGRDIGEINLLDGGSDNGKHFAPDSTLARSQRSFRRKTERRSARLAGPKLKIRRNLAVTSTLGCSDGNP